MGLNVLQPEPECMHRFRQLDSISYLRMFLREPALMHHDSRSSSVVRTVDFVAPRVDFHLCWSLLNVGISVSLERKGNVFVDILCASLGRTLNQTGGRDESIRYLVVN